MVKLNLINQKACLINWNHETYDIQQQFIKSLTKIKFLRPYEMFFVFFQYQFYFYHILFSINFLESILMVSLTFNNQKHL